MRYDLHKSLSNSSLNLRDLGAFQRNLMTTDGTITDTLEVYFLEPIHVIVLSQELITTRNNIPPLQLQKGSEVIERKILLRGKFNERNLVYAESIIVTERLETKFKDGLIKSQKPMGLLWLECRMETYKEIIELAREPADGLSCYFNINEEDYFLRRTYRVFSKNIPVMMITEKFPETYFLDGFGKD